jgi:hypothetical protein
LNHDERRLATLKEKRDHANASWDRVFQKYCKGEATQEDLVLAIQICNDAQIAYNEMKYKTNRIIPGK